MDIINLLERAGFETEVRDKWTAVIDSRPEFRVQFGSTRIGKVQKDRFYITPVALYSAAETLITDAGLEIHHLASSNSSRNAVYPGFSIAGRSEEELDRFVANLRTVVNSQLSQTA